MMDLKKHFIETAQSLLMHKFRSFLSVLGIIFGVAAFISMLSVGEGAKREAMRQIELLGTRNIIIRGAVLSESAQAEASKALSPGLTYADAEKLKIGCPFALSVAATRDITAEVLVKRRALEVSVAGTVPQFLRANNLELARGRFLCALDLALQKRVCAIGSEAAAKMFGDARRALHQKILLNNDWYEIVGVLEGKAQPGKQFAAISHRPVNTQIYIPLANAMNMPSPPYIEGANVSEIIVQVDRSEKVPQYAEIVRKILERTHRGIADYDLVVPQELLMHVKQSQRIFNVVLGSIAAISLIVGGIGIMNIMLATVSERTGEIGIRRAVGASRKDILTQFLSETMLLTFSGGVLGLVVGFILAKVISVYADWDTVISIKNLVIALFVSGAAGISFGLYPAVKASRMDPIEALRFE